MSRPRSRGILARGEEPKDGLKEADEPRSLVLSVASLNNLVFPRKDFLLKDLGTPTLVYTSDFEDLSRVYIGIRAPAHHRDVPDHAFVDLGRVKESIQKGNGRCGTCTEE